MVKQPIDEIFDQAVQQHRAGQYQQAATLYRQILTSQPDEPDALHLLGMIEFETGNPESARQLIRRAITLDSAAAEYHYHLGLVLASMGRLDEAIGAFRQTVAIWPQFADAHNNLGETLRLAGNLDDAVEAFHQAIEARPKFPAALYNLANVYQALGRLDESISLYRRAIASRPDFAEAYSNLGNALRSRGDLDPAVHAFRQALSYRKNYAAAHNNLGCTLADMGKYDEAIQSFQRALAVQPDLVDAIFNVAESLKKTGELDKALSEYRRVIAQRPDYSRAYRGLGITLYSMLKHDEAIAVFQEQVDRWPHDAAAINDLGVALLAKGKIKEATRWFEEAIAIKPDYADAFNNLGNVYERVGQIHEAILAFRKSFEMNPGFVGAHSNYLYSLYFDPEFNTQSILKEHQLFDARHIRPLRSEIRPHRNDRRPDRRLKIGYVSPDFRFQAESFFTVPLLSSHDHRQFEIFCYSNVSRPDNYTERISRFADHWRTTEQLSDVALTKMIRDDQIDVLVDLTMHMSHGRPLVFARKPAPVQAAWLAYPGTTGLSTMDYRISDPWIDPPDQSDADYSEKTFRLPETWACFSPLTEVALAPRRIAGPIRFACLNNPRKINPQIIEVWCDVLAAVGQSTLLLLGVADEQREQISKQISSRGIDPARIQFATYTNRIEYLNYYNQFDIALDTLPYCGITTTCEALWMGVPVISLIGNTAPGRAGLSILTAAGLGHLAAADRPQFVKIAQSLAGDLSFLDQPRSKLRDQFRASPMMDAKRFARNMEAAYRRMWTNWCLKTDR